MPHEGFVCQIANAVQVDDTRNQAARFLAQTVVLGGVRQIGLRFCVVVIEPPIFLAERLFNFPSLFVTDTADRVRSYQRVGLLAGHPKAFGKVGS